ncbi:MAG: esterase family protein [Anaerolineae bacterium]|nr:esterase family protein [Anaerolineae bacterium]
MPIVAYGHWGPPLLMLPTAAADYLEYERFGMIQALAPFIDAGRLRVYSINSVLRWSLLDYGQAPYIKAALLTAYDQYIAEEVVPWIRTYSQDPFAWPVITGISMGAYLAANTFLKHSDILRGLIAFSGTYDIRSYFGGYHDDNVYFNNPAEYLPNLNDDYHLSRLRDRSIILYTGQGPHEDPGRTYHLSNMLNAKGIQHWLDVWGHDVAHDWPWWLKAMPIYANRLF